jgi:hypothetical protein
MAPYLLPVRSLLFLQRRRHLTPYRASPSRFLGERHAMSLHGASSFEVSTTGRSAIDLDR